ncbi:MAG: EamA family transporter [bacterium]|nr:EamA family transporter [bacterium]
MKTEARAKIENYRLFRDKILLKGAKEKESYFFRDHIFVPKTDTWDINEEAIKVRIKDGQATIIYQAAAWKNKIKETLKGFRKEVKKATAFELMERWNFKELFSYSRVGYVYQLGKYSFVVEKIDKVGWVLEVEDEPQNINGLMRLLGLKKVKKTVPQLYENAAIREQKGRGVLYAFLSAFFVSTSYVTSKYLLEYTTPESLMFLWYLAAALIAVLVVVTHKQMKFNDTFKTNWKIGLIIGFVNAAAILLWIYAIKLIGPSPTAFLLTLTTVFAIALGALFLKERLRKLDAIGVSIAVFGALIMNFGGGGYTVIGSTIAIISAFAIALDAFIAKKYMKNVQSIVLTSFRALFTLGFLTIAVFATGKFTVLPIIQAPILVLSVFLSAIFGTLFLYKAIKRLKIAQVVTIRTLDPFVVVIYSFLFLGIMPATKNLIGGTFIVAGVMLMLFNLEKVKFVLKRVEQWI